MIYFDGKIFSDSASWLNKLTPGRVKGRGVFETMRAQGSRILFLDEHLSRLKKGLKHLRIPSPARTKEYKGILKACLLQAGFRCSRVRLMAWRLSQKMHIAVVIVPYRPLSFLKYNKGLRVAILRSGLARGEMLFGIKSIRYKKFLSAYQFAVQHGFDDIILLDRQGGVLETSRANIFFVKNGNVVTPHLRYGCLDGLTRREVLKIVKRKRIPCKETKVAVSDLLDAQEVFCTNSLVGIMPLVRIDKIKIGCGQMGPVTKKIWSFYHKYYD